jgi:hypothetical protein
MNVPMIDINYRSGSSMSNGQIFFESPDRFFQSGDTADPLVCCQGEDAVLTCSTQLEATWSEFDICSST